MDVNEFKNKFSISQGKVVKKSKRTKYNNVKSDVDGQQFDSVKESEFYGQLKIKKNAGLIQDFKTQVKYEVVVNGVHICNYFLDFQVKNNDGSITYIDIKGKDIKTKKFIKTHVFQIKKKLVEAIYGIKITLI